MSALSFLLVINHPSCRRLLRAARPRFTAASRSDCPSRSRPLLVRVLLVRSSWHSMSRSPWHPLVLQHRFTRALVFGELPARPRAHVPSSSTRWLLPRPLSSSARCAWVCSPALSRRGWPAAASFVLKLCTWHACDNMDRAFDSCGTRLGLDMSHVAIVLVVHSVGQREAAMVHRASRNLIESGRSSRSISASLPQALASASGCTSRQSLEY